MAVHYFRAQHKGYNFEEMKTWNSQEERWNEDTEEWETVGEGIACTINADGYEGGSMFGGSWGAMEDDDEVVVFEGIETEELYDSHRVIPTKEIARFTKAQWEQMLEDGTAYNLEQRR